MTATLQLFQALGFGRYALPADLMFCAVSGVVTFALIARSQRAAAVADAAGSTVDVVAEAEAVVAGSADHQPA